MEFEWSSVLVPSIMVMVVVASLLTAGILFKAFTDLPERTVEDKLVNTSYTIGNWSIEIVDGKDVEFDENWSLSIGVRRDDTNDTYTAVVRNCLEAYAAASQGHSRYINSSTPCPELNQTIRTSLWTRG